MNGTNDIPEFPEFRKLTFEDKALLEALFKEMQPQISELTFTNLYVWNEAEPVQLSRHNKTALIQRRRIRDGKNVLLPPLTNEPIPTVQEDLRKAAVANHSEILLYGIDSKQAGQLSARYRVEPDRDNWDYVYLSSDLADLPGDKYHSKRNFITRCLADHKCEYAKLDASVVNDCLQLQTEWCNLRQCGSVPSLEAENKAIKTIFDKYPQLAVFGGAVYVDGKLEAFTLAESLNNDTAVIHFEKANPQITGLYQLINQWLCQNTLRTFTYVNREQDLGIPGLRKAKLSYHPHHMIEKYSVTVT
ncbi:MAG: phosphatidylglycerol lysyltransferase domain-containing protein [Candidatus Bathyarchaeia archaeon]